MVPVIICSSICQGAFFFIIPLFSQLFQFCLLFFCLFSLLSLLWEQMLLFILQLISNFFCIQFVIVQVELNSFLLWLTLEMSWFCRFTVMMLLIKCFDFCLIAAYCVMAVTKVKLWSLFSPQGVDNTGDVYRATYTAFRCSRVSGTMGTHEKMQVGAQIQLDLSFTFKAGCFKG